jgi:hypothetical protein
MAIEPANLIQVQSSLQDPTVTNEYLIKYANGSNPEVPPFLALIEMNRRKQIEESNSAFQNSNKGTTVKDQVAGALTSAPTGINPLANPATINPTAPRNAVNPTTSLFGAGITQLPQGVNPTQAPPVQQPAPNVPVEAAGGGLMSLPVNHFNEQSYAGGGIVAFGNPNLNPDEQQLVSFPQERPNKRVLNDAQIAAELARASQSEAPVATPSGPRLNPNSFQGILAALPQAAQLNIPTIEPINRAQAYENIQESQRLAGVSEDPYKEVNKRQTAKEKREQEAYERGGIDRLIAQAAAFGKADPAKGFGAAMGAGAEASLVLQKEQDALRDKQENASIEFYKSIAKEEDAKRRGNAAAIETAVADREKKQMEMEKLKFDQAKIEHDRGMLAANIYHTEESSKNSRALLNKPSQYAEQVALATNNPDLFRLIQGQGKSGELTFEEALKAVNADPLSKMKTPDEKVRLAQQYLDAFTRMRRTGSSTDPTAPPPAPVANTGFRLPSWLGGPSTPPSNAVPFDQLPR